MLCFTSGCAIHDYVHLNTLQYLLSIDIDRDVVEVSKSVHKLDGSRDVDRCIIVQCLQWKYALTNIAPKLPQKIVGHSKEDFILTPETVYVYATIIQASDGVSETGSMW